MPDQRELRTKDVLQATGITHQILYRYVTMGLVEELDGAGRAQRRFPAETIAVIKLIQGLNKTGYTLRDIKDIFFKEERLRSMRLRLRQDAGSAGAGTSGGGGRAAAPRSGVEGVDGVKGVKGVEGVKGVKGAPGGSRRPASPKSTRGRSGEKPSRGSKSGAPRTAGT